MLEYIEYIKKNKLGVVFLNKTFKELTTIRIGGPINILYYPNTIDNFIMFYRFYIENKKCPIVILGNGSNILANDKEYKGIVICFKKIMFKYFLFHDVLTISSGVMINDAIHYLKKQNKGGLEKLYYIPATIGGMVKMNASAYDCSISDNIVKIKTIDEFGNINIYNKDDIKFEYRNTSINDKEIILEVAFKITQKEESEINNIINDIKNNRKNKYPLVQYNAGSTFKNPKNKKSWFLIDSVGLRGISINDACVSNKHCNFLINKKNCSSEDMIKLINVVINKVKDRYNVILECELKLINF